MKKLSSVFILVCLTGALVFAAGGNQAAPSGGAGGLRGDLVLYSTMTDHDLTNLLSGFGAKYPNINVEVVNGSAGELTSRIAAESANPQGDLMWGGLNSGDGDTYKDLFEHWLSQYENEVYDDYRSNNGFYNMDHLSTIVFCVNTDLEKELGLNIKGYADLLDPKLNGRIVLSDPNSSSAAWNNVANIMAVYGHDSAQSWDLIEKLLRNNMVIVTSSSVCFRAVADGEYVVGLTYEDGVAPLLKSGAKNIKMVYPAEGASAFPFGCAVIKGAKNMENAKAMVSYLMSPEGQGYLGNALGTLRFTNKNAKYNSPYLPPDNTIKWVTRDMKWLISNKEQVLAHWNRLYASIRR